MEKQPRQELASANSEKRAQDARLQESGLGAEISFHSRSDLQQLQRPAPSLDEADPQSPPVCGDEHVARRNRRRLILRIIQTSCALHPTTCQSPGYRFPPEVIRQA